MTYTRQMIDKSTQGLLYDFLQPIKASVCYISVFLWHNPAISTVIECMMTADQSAHNNEGDGHHVAVSDLKNKGLAYV